MPKGKGAGRLPDRARLKGCATKSLPAWMAHKAVRAPAPPRFADCKYAIWERIAKGRE